MGPSKHILPLRDYCRENAWPRLPQWRHWIAKRSEIAQHCIKKVEGRYIIDVAAFEEFLSHSSLDGEDGVA